MSSSLLQQYVSYVRLTVSSSVFRPIFIRLCFLCYAVRLVPSMLLTVQAGDGPFHLLVVSGSQHFAWPVKETFLVFGRWARPSVVNRSLSRLKKPYGAGRLVFFSVSSCSSRTMLMLCL